ncbi:choice-of-anchor Q domain-containing protein [Streptomyces sp. NPDC093544]|uniref:choice-of-anchor Q domain-containing protein n=1 Tax=Streptomyces sp. NPDC093544 TaxID=3155200 RepID=UPI00344A5AB2
MTRPAAAVLFAVGLTAAALTVTAAPASASSSASASTAVATATATATVAGTPVGARTQHSGPAPHTKGGRTFYLDAENGNDQAAGTSSATAWKTLARITAADFRPGDTIALRRGETFTGTATINGTGTAAAPITVTAYGTGAAPTLTNPTGWNMLQLSAPHVVVDQLKFADGVVFDNADGVGIRGPKYELSGAIALTDAATDAYIHDNEFTQVGLGVKTYATGTLIAHNSFHDLKIAFRGMDSGSEASYGAIGISINNSDARVTANEFINCRSTDSPYGADGGAVEIEGFDHPKDDISIDHNLSLGSQGFTEVTETTTADVHLTYNISDDYQQFLAYDTTTHPDAYLVAHNTIVRDRGDKSRLFAIYYYREAGPTPQDSWLTITGNIIQMSGGSVLKDYAWPHDHNVIQGTLGDDLGTGDILADPQFTDRSAGDYRPLPTSPAINSGGAAAGRTDFYGNRASVGAASDAGAIESQLRDSSGH